MTKRRGVVWKNFLILMSFMSVLIMLSTFLIYQNAIAVMKEEICNVNMNQAYQVEHNLIQIIEQTDRLASSLCIRDEVKLFWGMESPERADNGFYSKLYYNLKTQVYSMNDRISSIVLYSPTYRRIMDETLSTPYVLTGKERDKEQNIDWIEELEELEDDRIRTSIQLRAIRDSYPYVMTIVKQTVGTSGWGAAAIDIDLNKIHSIIWPETAQGISIWVLDEEGRVIIREKKNELYADATYFEKLNLFERTSEEISVIREDGEVPITYSQRYCEEYGLYIVSVSELEDFNRQMRQARLNAIGIGMGCVLLACILIWIYVTFASKPIKSILNLLENPLDYHEYTNQSEQEVQEIVDRIVSNLQMNNNLRQELDKRIDILRQTQMQALKAQINPHFLFNTLNVIVMLIDEEVEDSCAAQVTADLADVLHYSLSDEDLVVLKDELDHTRKYVYILEQRYCGNFKTRFDIAPELLDIRVPKLILQPLIENAVFHGIVARDTDSNGLLTIIGRKELCVFEQEEIWGVRIDIIDNGHGMTEEEIRRVVASLKDEHIGMSHIGVQNVAKRLALLFPHNSRLDIKSKVGEGTCISLVFPYTEPQT